MKWEWLPATQFSEIESIWQDMNNHNTASLLLDIKFVRQLIVHFSNGIETIGICYQGTVPVAIGIFVQNKYGFFETFQPSQAPIGLWLTSKNVSMDNILESLVRKSKGINAMASILHQDPDLSIRPINSNKIRTIDYIQTSFINIEGSFEDYWLKRSINLRHNLKRQRNRLIKEGVKTRFDVITQPDEILKAVEEYGELESKGWKGQEGTNINISNSQGQFYSMVLQDFAQEHKSIIFKYWYDQLLVAMDLCVRNDTTLIILKTTYDENQKNSSPAFLMLEEIVQYVFDSKNIKKIEFFGKVMDWHTKWIDEKDIRTMYHINAYRLSIMKLIHDTFSKFKNK